VLRSPLPMGEKQGEGARTESVLLHFCHPDLLPRGEGAYHRDLGRHLYIP